MEGKNTNYLPNPIMAATKYRKQQKEIKLNLEAKWGVSRCTVLATKTTSFFCNVSIKNAKKMHITLKSTYIRDKYPIVNHLLIALGQQH